MMTEKTMYEQMLDALRAAGLRLTPQRRAVCRVLATSEAHPSAQMIFDSLRQEETAGGALGDLSLATVYNTLDTLSRLGVINVLGEVGSSDSVRYDADTAPHVNLACVRCHRIIDISSHHVHDLESEVEKSSGYTLLGARVLYYGICPDCQSLIETAETTNTETIE